ncbi:XkdX family protein (plasmid) [Paucilactobacillus suebicus]|nr:XkdX family protein [Paucilactobacillus suebicus]
MDIDFIEQMYVWGCDIKGYVAAESITADQYKTITGTDYTA